MKYVELNAVRAHLVDDPGDYRFCSWGAWQGSGRHPCQRAFFKHMKRSLGEVYKRMTLNALESELRAEMARTLAAEAGLDAAEREEAVAEAREGPGMRVRFGRRMRHWSDGAIIGSKAFVREVGAGVFGGRASKKRLGQADFPSGASLYSFRQLRA